LDGLNAVTARALAWLLTLMMIQVTALVAKVVPLRVMLDCVLGENGSVIAGDVDRELNQVAGCDDGLG
jgi:hypothetical protein